MVNIDLMNKEELKNYFNCPIQKIKESNVKNHITSQIKELDFINNITTNTQVYYTPSQLQTAYGLNLLTGSNSTKLGYGQKICVVIAYHYRNLQNDLNVFSQRFNLPSTTLHITTLGTQSNSGWAMECCLDVQMIHSIAPYATIYVIEAASSSLTDMRSAVQYANNLGVNIISMSWGSNEYSSQSSFDSVFSNSSICYCCSSGDVSDGVNYPSSSKNCLAIGGSTLLLNSNNTRKNETIWSSSGCGLSQYTIKPTWQTGLNLSSNYRSTPDICLVGDPSTGAVIYYNGNYYIVGGSSLSCPIMAGILTVTNQFRLTNNKPVLTTVGTSNYLIQKYLYQNIYGNNTLYTNNLFDITSGIDGIYSPSTKFDICSGLGSLKCNTLIPSLAGF